MLRNVTEAPIHVLGLPAEEAAARARLLLDRVGLADKLDARPGSLSGGQQQRVAIARTLAMEPRCILFDEPTSALDPLMTAEVLAVVADLADSGQTMIVVTHAMEFARKVAHRVHVFDDGLSRRVGLRPNACSANRRARPRGVSSVARTCARPETRPAGAESPTPRVNPCWTLL